MRGESEVTLQPSDPEERVAAVISNFRVGALVIDFCPAINERAISNERQLLLHSY